MSVLREVTFVSRIELVLPANVLQVQRTTVIVDVEAPDAASAVRSQPTYRRTTYLPGDDLGHEEPSVQRLAAAAWLQY